ncbi:amino acid ABC transporter substrate-binding protein, PAAT family (TC 3.A.1.3.-) [Pseudoxanthobacter soli DSM 19599]|uniref:Amino acid ABC transporter substrate-binding protein, PAAT family (TC 3.A.1.3.-) n=1 Tax=Pseudoxanthobacter soli DSM 19599 TaxID=1123029 RepID=A0A1M7ZS20_9HYPH|nr:transporter substrate-binding domain-containing protein [Pseudoxanthobacter soli]SHO67703.1 amino acid ABC transporter substrate-binding protein, PAAT family (TC 3.A.1.3.-) [Pseudoxanthobacter soli DSM 19599]
MRLKLLPALALALVGALASAPANAQELELIQPGKLLIATEGTYPPFSMRSPDGQLDGLEIRVGKEIAKRLNLEYTPVIIKWEALLVGLAADQYDFASDAMDITAERQKQVTFADGWLESGGRVVIQKDSPIKSAADLKGKTVGVLVASTWAKLAEEHGATVKSYKAESDAMQDLVNGQVDAVITDSIAAAYAIEQSKLPLTMTPDYLSHVQKGFPFKKGKPNLVKAVNKALADMIADGTYAKLTVPLVGYDPAPKDPIKTQF